eukprot:2111604-Rhodomonas_salina.1
MWRTHVRESAAAEQQDLEQREPLGRGKLEQSETGSWIDGMIPGARGGGAGGQIDGQSIRGEGGKGKGVGS